jgi:hypothetical protein
MHHIKRQNNECWQNGRVGLGLVGLDVSFFMVANSVTLLVN